MPTIVRSCIIKLDAMSQDACDWPCIRKLVRLCLSSHVTWLGHQAVPVTHRQFLVSDWRCNY
jgi:hypothetical protein